MNLHHLLVPTVFFSAALVLAGCAAEASSSAPSTAASGAASSAPSAPPAASESDAKTGPFPCNVFSLSDIKTATGYDVLVAKPITAVGKASQVSCEYVDAANRSFGIMTDTSNAGDHLNVFSLIENTGSAVTGIGDSAWGNDSNLAVSFGNDYVQLSDDSDAEDESAVLANIGLEKLKEMAQRVHAAM
ncbi:MAG: hypothetical protein ABI400_12325 [Lacisediminihabitans sp.]